MLAILTRGKEKIKVSTYISQQAQTIDPRELGCKDLVIPGEVSPRDGE